MLDTISSEASSSSSRGTTDKVILADEAAEDAVTVTYKIELSCLRVFCPVCPFVEKKTTVHCCPQISSTLSPVDWYAKMLPCKN